MLLEVLPHWGCSADLCIILRSAFIHFCHDFPVPRLTIFAYDLYGGLYKPEASEKEKTRVMRIMIVIVGIAAIALSSFQPAVVTTINWIFTWGVPMFVMLVIGLCWKRNTMAAVITYIVSWIANVVWITCGLMEKLDMTNFHQVYLCTIISVVLGLVLTAVLPGSKPGYFKLSKEEREAC